MFANNFEEFTKKSTKALQNALNTKAGQELTTALLMDALEENPSLTPEEWTKIKQDFMVFIWHTCLVENPDLMEELGDHLWNELTSNKHQS